MNNQDYEVRFCEVQFYHKPTAWASKIWCWQYRTRRTAIRKIKMALRELNKMVHHN